jgi:hemoglobin
MFRRIGLAFCLVVTLAVVATAQAPRAATRGSMSGPMANGTTGQDKKTLYARLGGYDAIAAVVDDFVGRLVADKRLNKFFVGHSEDSLHKIRQHVVDQLCNAAGGPCLYTGRDMRTSHHGLGITNEDWDVSVKHLVATLDKVPKAEQDELLAVVGTLKKDIVDK